MANHKWEDKSNRFQPKCERCIKCGIERNWFGGNMQGWGYIDYRLPIGEGRITLYRPSCTPNLAKGITALSRKGKYI